LYVFFFKKLEEEQGMRLTRAAFSSPGNHYSFAFTILFIILCKVAFLTWFSSSQSRETGWTL